MTSEENNIEQLATKEYKYGFETTIDADTAPKGLNEDIIRLEAYRHIHIGSRA